MGDKVDLDYHRCHACLRATSKGGSVRMHKLYMYYTRRGWCIRVQMYLAVYMFTYVVYRTLCRVQVHVHDIVCMCIYMYVHVIVRKVICIMLSSPGMVTEWDYC